ncbi:hypothetical protein FOPG_19644 [Fusarium oxysporum f. sp. conglutinans race 2 54008]|uniref:Uncharacterized protein n=1 Tax=Fusarium oxysporum f. sp. conglutinans race 2 54008 TaxID=1089457 RepID=X0GW80_FUSOX|nr:hypothetical protein FOPG_19644 [Fusarium oxysporum f. sp. conglutinans race 2 54008]
MDRGSTEWIHAWIQWSGLQPWLRRSQMDSNAGNVLTSSSM